MARIPRSSFCVLFFFGLLAFAPEDGILRADPDTVEAPPSFRRGDVDGSGVVDISDPIFNLTVQL